MSRILSIDELSVNYGQLAVVDRINLEISSGKITSLIGPNGCGKSTITKAVAGLISYSGEINATKKLAYLPQQDSLMPWLNVMQNILLPAKLKKIDLLTSKKRAEKYLKKFELLDFADKYPQQLSGGMRQKVALLRAVLYQPDLVLMDEPFSALDSITRLQMQDWLLNLKNQEGFACLLVTHDIVEAINLSDTIVALSQRPATIIKQFIISTSDRNQPVKKAKLEQNLKEILLNEKV